jgi:hypothetical protein
MIMAPRLLAVLTGVLLATPVAASAQAPTPRPDQIIKVDVVLSRDQAEKRVSNMPFTLWVDIPGDAPLNNAFGQASLRVGMDVPIGATSATTTQSRTTPAGNAQNTTGVIEATTKPEYRNLGTSIDVMTSAQVDGRYRVRVNLSDTSVFDPDAQRTAALVARGLAPANPSNRTSDASAFRTLQFTNTLPMRDGQAVEFASATDRITGETVKLTVTITLVK